MPSQKDEFECNDLRVIGDDIVVRRGPFGTRDSKCGRKLYKYSKANWTFQQTSKVCPRTGTPIWLMTAV